MLRQGWLCARLSVRPSTSTAFAHTSASQYSLPKVKPHEDEMPQPARERRPPVEILDLGKRRPKKKEINLVVPETHLEQWTKMEPKGLISAYLQLSKSKLTMLVTSTAVAGVLMAPVSISAVPLAACAAGTALLSSAANACNQLLEAPYDAQMKRTHSRVLVVHRFSPLHALSFAGVAAVCGAGTLYFFANPLAAALGVLNVALYVGVYTPLKRTHIACTWAGALVRIAVLINCFTLFLLCTALLSSAANACNQLLEAPYDAQMKRTHSRVLVVHRFSPLHALSFAGVAAVCGAGTLYFFANPLAAGLGVLNVALYVGIYTPLKRTHIACTWAGALVGAIPPLMGYAAATGTLDASAFCMAAILYSWQFPHFNGLSWNLRGDYSKAGYRVMCVTNERLCRVTSIRHSLALVGLCSIAAPLTNLTTITFALDSLPVNAYMCWLAYKFYKAPDAQNSRKLFFYSLFYLPLIMTLMVVSNYGRSGEQKKSLSERIQSFSKVVNL
ncbi:protoheme IX farnesyltransferase [Ancylostoma caninum]|uniref:Protoheme IX farnesyltransferase, mitochondrial n=1 Tax=Ancylostoma caninum TaxID=29170 RepID=A0A368GGC9_ANCCA|nr:protoheme IX farnesyltransferase [Ancylostoma caninum]